MHGYEWVRSETLSRECAFSHHQNFGDVPFISIDPGVDGAGVIGRKNKRYPLHLEVLYFHLLTDDYEGVIHLASKAVDMRAYVVLMESQYVHKSPKASLDLARNAERFITTFAMLWMRANHDNPVAPPVQVFEVAPSLWQTSLGLGRRARRADLKRTSMMFTDYTFKAFESVHLLAGDDSLLKAYKTLPVKKKSGVADATNQAGFWSSAGGAPSYRGSKRRR